MKRIFLTVVLVSFLSFGATTASALQGALNTLNAHYTTNLTACTICHTSPPAVNAFGAEYLAAGGDKTGAIAPNWVILDAGDADGDGITNAAEFAAGTNPAGDAAGGTKEQATVTGCVTNNIQIPFLLFLGLMASLLLFGKKSTVLSKVE